MFYPRRTRAGPLPLLLLFFLFRFAGILWVGVQHVKSFGRRERRAAQLLALALDCLTDWRVI